ANVRNPLTEGEEVDERDEAREVERKRDFQKGPIVDEDRRAHQPQADGDPERLSGREAVEPGGRARGGRRSDKKNSQDRERKHASQNDQIEPPRRGKHAGDHRRPPHVTRCDARCKPASGKAARRGGFSVLWVSGPGLPNFFRNSALASGAAALPPCPPCSTNTTTTICGSSTGAKPANHAWSSSFFLSAPALIEVSRPITWTVPVFPPASTPGIRELNAVPPGSFMPAHTPLMTIAAFSGDSGMPGLDSAR